MSRTRHLFIFVLLVTVLTCCQLLANGSKNQPGENHPDGSAAILNEKAREQLNISLPEALNLSGKALEKALETKQVEQQLMALFLQSYCHFHLGNINMANEGFTRGIQLGKQLNNNYWLAEFLIAKGEVKYNNGKFETSYRYFNEALSIATKANLPSPRAKSLNFIGKYYHSVGHFDSSFEYYEKALEIYDTTPGCLSQKAYVLNNIGKHYNTKGEFVRSLQCFLRAYKLLEKDKDMIILGSTFNHIGNIYDDLGDYRKALYYHKRGLEIRKTIGYQEGIAKSLKNIAEIYIDIDSLSMAQTALEQSLAICKDIGYKKGINKCYNNLGEIALDKELHDKSMHYFNNALEVANSIGYVKGICKACNNIGNLYKDIDQPDSAIYYFEKSISLAKKEGLLKTLRKNYRELSGLYKSKNDHEIALRYHELFHQVNEELANVETNTRIAQMQSRFELEQADRENELLKKENQIKNLELESKNIIILGISIILVLLMAIVVITYIRFRNNRKTNMKLKKLTEKVTTQNRQLSRLNEDLNRANKERDKFFGIIAHELRNPLWWFRNLTELLSRNFESMNKQKIQKTLFSLDESAKNAFHLTDNLLNWSRLQLDRIIVNKQKLVLQEILNECMDLFKTVAEYKKVDLEVKLTTDYTSWADKDLLTTVLRNLISNALKYTPEGGQVQVTACQSPGNLVRIMIKDTGIGIDKRGIAKIMEENIQFTTLGISQEKGSGIGINICKEFIRLNGGSFFVDSEINKGSVFSFTVPLYDKHALKQMATKNRQTTSV